MSDTTAFGPRHEISSVDAPQPLLPCDPYQTDNTGKTGIVESREFLLAVFGTDLLDVCPVVISFKGNPASAHGNDWKGRPWQGTSDACLELPASANNYFSLAVFKQDTAGLIRRQKAHFHALYAVMLDDIGTKVPMERLTVPPTWLLETSRGNHQAGYLLREPLTDGSTADRLMNAVVAAGLSDPGANGPTTRLARLPVGANGKHRPPFPCRMIAWSPELRYSVKHLLDGLQLNARFGRREGQSTRPASQPIGGDPVWIPRPEENAVISALRRRGLYKTQLAEGKHDITCPWVSEHTDGADAGTAYFEPDQHWPIGGFKCLHGHCADRHIRDLLSFLDIEVSAARMTATIRVVPGELHRVVDAAERELARSTHHYQRGGLIVTVVTDPGSRETRVQAISPPALVRALAGVASWERFDGRAGAWVRTDPPARHALVLSDSVAYRHLPLLNGLARQPYLRPDRTLATTAGYDSGTGMYGTFDASEFVVPKYPSREQAEAALTVLKELLKEFSFAGEADRAAAVMALLTAAVRPSLRHAPMFHVHAHMVGSGKSYLCELITALATEQRGAPTTFPADDEECRKLLIAELLRSPAVIEFDNLTGELVAHKSLCTALTSEYLSGRILGVSKTATVSTRTLFLSSGNNVGPVHDMARRCITINLSPELEIPAARTFERPELVCDVLRARGRYVSAALTIVRAWIAAGEPVTPCRSLAGFSDWAELCRQPLLWLGLVDPALSVFQAIAQDPDRETLGRLLIAWQSVFGRTAAMVRDAVKHAGGEWDNAGELRELLHDIADERGEINRRRLGWWIKKHAGQIVDGRRFVEAPGHRSADRWQVVDSVLSVLPVSDAPTPISVTSTSAAATAYARATRGA